MNDPVYTTTALCVVVPSVLVVVSATLYIGVGAALRWLTSHR